MSVTIKAGWLKDKQGNKLAPKTYFSQVQADDGTTLEQALEAAASSGSSVQPDWNQNDETAADYIKNKPFGEEIGYNVVFDETFSTANMDGLFAAELTTGFNIEPSTTYTIIYDNDTYEVEPVLVEMFGMYGVGNAAILGQSSATNEPFLIISDGTMAMIITSDTAPTEHTVQVSGISSSIVTIPEKFLPPMVGKNVYGLTMTDSEGNIYTAEPGAEIFNDLATNIASGMYSHAEGSETKAIGDLSHVEGESTVASGYASHAEGQQTTASGVNSHSEGSYTIASGDESHAEGQSTVASGYASHAEGMDTIAASTGQHVQGKYNIEDAESKYVHIVGNGDWEARSNAHTLDWSGNAWYAGTIKIGGTSYDDASEVALKSDLNNIDLSTAELITVEDIDQICGSTYQVANQEGVTF